MLGSDWGSWFLPDDYFYLRAEIVMDFNGQRQCRQVDCGRFM
jgi:hypothetical protein